MNTIPTTNGSSAATSSRRAVKTATGEGAAYWFFGGLAVIRSPDGALPVIIQMNVLPGEGVPLHRRTRLDDSYYVLSGRIAVRCGDEEFVAGWCAADTVRAGQRAGRAAAGARGSPISRSTLRNCSASPRQPGSR